MACPVGPRQSVVQRLAEPRDQGFPPGGHIIQQRDPRIDIMRPRHPARPEKGMYVLRDPLARRQGQVKIIERNHRRRYPMFR